MLASKQLVVGRRDLGGEGRIIRQLERLRGIREQRVHRVAPFVGVGRQPVIFVAQIEQQIGVNLVGAGIHVGARRLARPRQRVHPALRRDVAELLHIIGAHRLHRVDRQLPHLGEAVRPVRLHQRRVDVPIAHVGKPEHPLAKREIPMEHGKAAVGLRDQRAIDGFGRVAAVERRLERTVIVPRLGVEELPLDLRRQRRAETEFSNAL